MSDLVLRQKMKLSAKNHCFLFVTPRCVEAKRSSYVQLYQIECIGKTTSFFLNKVIFKDCEMLMSCEVCDGLLDAVAELLQPR